MPSRASDDGSGVAAGAMPTISSTKWVELLLMSVSQSVPQFSGKAPFAQAGCADGERIRESWVGAVPDGGGEKGCAIKKGGSGAGTVEYIGLTGKRVVEGEIGKRKGGAHIEHPSVPVRLPGSGKRWMPVPGVPVRV